MGVQVELVMPNVHGLLHVVVLICSDLCGHSCLQILAFSQILVFVSEED